MKQATAKRTALVAVGLGVVIAGGASALAANAAPADAPLHVAAVGKVPGQYIVVLKDGNAGASVARRLGVATEEVYTKAVKGFTAKLTTDELTKLRQDASVKYVEEDAKVSISDVTPPPLLPSGTRWDPAAEASGPSVATWQFGADWGLDRIDQGPLPLNGVYKYGQTGKGVTAYIIDTGIYPQNSEFGGRASGGFSSVTDGHGTTDCHGHGTHVAGTIGGKTYGVAKNVKLVGVRVLDCSGSGQWSDVIAGIDWVTYNHSGPSVANMSLGGGFSQAINDAVTASIQSGVFYAVAAGNSNADACLTSPSSTPDAFTVGATDNADARAWFSNYGACVDGFDPGVDIKSAWIGSKNATNTISGTSMATPHVVGLAALYLQHNQFSSPAIVTATLKADAQKDVVTDPMASPNLLIRKWVGTMNTGETKYQPDASWWLQGAGYIQASLAAEQKNVDLYLENWTGTAWVTVASSKNTDSVEHLVYSAPSGYYRIRATDVKGLGNYEVSVNHPA